ncbi:metalloprotease TIKI1-like, partial [Sinocyclocheilus grahami]|uniref:metalloprotease TIKI1-like n=1 Tax=Sinocyclocheilus grahami TaxID=75366 RepID=UPI0007AC85C3
MMMMMMMMLLVSWGAFLQTCSMMMMMVRANQQDLRETSCDLKARQSELNSFLWTIKRDPPSYFYGTIHVPYTRVWDFIPENSKQAFQQSSIVCFELDLTDPYTISALTSCQLLPQGENLQDLLPKDIYRRLKRHLEYVRLMLPSWMTPEQRGKGLYADYLFNAIAGNWERKRPVWVMLMVNSLTEADIKTRGVPVLDLYLAQEAQRMRKRTGAVEKVEEQCHPLNRFSFSQVMFALNQTLLQQESLRAGGLQVPYTTEHLIKHYNCGDLRSIIFNHDASQVPSFKNATLPASEQVTAQEIERYFRQELIYTRNERMGRRVRALLEEQPDNSFFFAFGAGQSPRDAPGCCGFEVPSFKNATLPASEQVTAQEIERYFRQELIYTRNERMGRRVRALLEEQPDNSFFFAFGAAALEDFVPSFKNATLPASEQVTAQEIERYFRQELIYTRNERMGRRVRALLEEQPDNSFFFAFGA